MRKPKTSDLASDEMTKGFIDGYDLSSPEPGPNHSDEYRHGFSNGRDDRHGMPRASAGTLRELAEIAIAKDAAR